MPGGNSPGAEAECGGAEGLDWTRASRDRRRPAALQSAACRSAGAKRQSASSRRASRSVSHRLHRGR
eukprot:6523057-Lingulodinium_polyedra.AAC.1